MNDYVSLFDCIFISASKNHTDRSVRHAENLAIRREFARCVHVLINVDSDDDVFGSDGIARLLHRQVRLQGSIYEQLVITVLYGLAQEGNRRTRLNRLAEISFVNSYRSRINQI